jgi:hypothetical protein
MIDAKDTAHENKPAIPNEGMPIPLGCPRCGHYPPKNCGDNARSCEKCTLVWIEDRTVELNR